MTHRDSQYLISKYNNRNYIEFLEDKVQFATIFTEYFCRDFLNLKKTDFEEFSHFMQNKDRVICKPLSEGQGRGIEVVQLKDYDSLKDMYRYIIKSNKNFGIAEELISQHDILSNIYNGAINTVRIMTMLTENKCDILQAEITFGNGSPVANQRLGGISAPIDIETGVIMDGAIDSKNIKYDEHPRTKNRIKSVQIPYWQDVLDMVKEASKVVPETRYIGWDIAITPEGPILIEGNTSPGYAKLQNPKHLHNQTGIRPIYEKYL